MKLGELIEREFSPRVSDYLTRLMQRPALHWADAMKKLPRGAT